MNTPRKYFEVWGDNLMLLNLMRTAIIILAFAVIGLVILLVRSQNKLPIVVKVDSLGKPEIITDWRSENNVSMPEVKNFTLTFMELFTGYNYYTWDDNFRKAFKMMTIKFQPAAQEYLVKNEIDVQIQKDQYKTKVYISEPYEEVKDGKDTIRLKIRGYRIYESYLNKEFHKEEIFGAELVLKKVQRGFKESAKKGDTTEVSPWGLLVDYYDEKLYK